MADVVALGEILIDFAQKEKDARGYPTLVAQPGGAPANYLAALAKYGTSCGMIGKVGDDTFGHLLVKTLQDAGIDTHNVVVDGSFFTTLAFVTLDDKGDRRFSFARKPGADTKISFDEIDLARIADAKVFHFGTLSMAEDTCLFTTLACLDYAKSKNKLISFDPNLRLNLWPSAEKAKAAMLSGLKFADVVKISDEEVQFLFGCDEVQGAEIILSQFGAQLVYVTMGAKGCYYANRKFNGYVDSPAGIKAMDTTGAGDIFGGSAMYRLLQTGKSPYALTDADMQDICRFATAAASLSTQQPGGINSVPAMEDVLKLL